jgi:lipoprotein NlpD
MSKNSASKTTAAPLVKKTLLSKVRAVISRHLSSVLFLTLMAGCTNPPHPWEAWGDHQREQDVAPVLVTTPSGTKVKGVYHTIGRGETLWRIAKTYDIDLQLLAELNDIDDPAKIKAGEKVFILGATEKKKVVMEKTPPPPSSSSAPKIKTEKNKFMWPVDGKVVSDYGVRNGLRYEGIEIAAIEGTTVRAAKDGTVIYDGTLKGYGNVIILKHDDNFKTVYAFNRVNLVTEGGHVNIGEAIATVGKSGQSSRPGLHFQVWKGDRSRNPLFFLP